MKRLLFISSLLLASFLTIGAKEQFIYTQISRNEGLTSTVNCIYKEKNGDVWFGTPGGLYRFNGYDFRHYEDSLFRDRTIFQINEDMQGSIWVLSDKGVMRKKAAEEGFEHISNEDADTGLPFYCMCQGENVLWFGSKGKIFIYRYGQDGLDLLADLDERPSFICSHINRIDEETLMCCSHNGIILTDIRTGTVSNAPYGPYKEVSAAYTDSRGLIWIAFYNKGLQVFSRDGKHLKSYNTSNSDLSNNMVLCMTERNGDIWAGTDGGGINIIDLKNDKITILSHISGDHSSFPAHSIKSIHTDHYNNIWAGSIRDGLIRISRSGMKTYTDSYIGLTNGLSNPTVLCLHQDRVSNDIWIGTDGEGINKFDPRTKTFTHYPGTLNTKVVSIAEYSDTELALSIYSDCILLFNKHTGATRPLQANDKNINYTMRYAGRSINLADRKDGSLLLISNTILILDKSTGECIQVETENKSKANGNFLIIGNDNEGLWLHDYHYIYLLPEGKSTLLTRGYAGGRIINSGHLGKDGEIWLATDDGLCCFHSDKDEFSSIETSLFTKASSVAYDGRSKVWVGTDKNLFAYLTDEQSFAMFGTSDGATPNEYLSKPHLVSIEGDVYLGGVQGLLCIESDYTIDASEEPSFSLYSLSADRERIYANEEGLFEIPRNSKLLSIKVSTKERDIFRQKMYRFSIKGSGKEYELMTPALEIQDIPKPGTYDILVSCTKRNGDWSRPYSIMTLKIPQPWYKTGWFITICTLFTLLVGSSILNVVINRRKSNLQLALKEQEQMVYEEKVRMLINISHELRTPLTLIIAPLKRLMGQTGPDDERSATLNRIYRQSKRMKDLLDMILDLRKLEVGKSSLKVTAADFNVWIANAVEDIVNEEKTEGIYIVTEPDPSIGQVSFDKKKCETVLMNILMNAIKHSTKGDHIIIRTSLSESGFVRVSIIDQGPGLGDIDRSRMFTRFYQSNSEQYGSGIGLSYSKILVELHGGRIGAENNSDKGATFWWEIPVSSDSEIPQKAYLNELIGHNTADGISIPETSGFSTTGMKLLLVDDNQDLLDFLCEALLGEFAEITTASSGNKALSILEKEILPDIIVSDVNMPDGDGYRLCSELKRDNRYSHIPVVLLTARGEEQSQSDSYRMGADAFMAKPFEVDTLLELLRGLLKKRNEIRKKYLDNNEKVSSDYGSNEEIFIIRLNKVISENLSNPELDQQLLCRELGLSRASLYNKMKSITGAGAKEYITKIRLEKAKKLIEDTEITLAEVSDMTGFASQSYFSTAFKNYTGHTPSQYKHIKKKN